MSCFGICLVVWEALCLLKQLISALWTQSMYLLKQQRAFLILNGKYDFCERQHHGGRLESIWLKRGREGVNFFQAPSQGWCPRREERRNQWCGNLSFPERQESRGKGERWDVDPCHFSYISPQRDIQESRIWGLIICFLINKGKTTSL